MSLFDRIGGDYTINAVVDSFYEKVLADDSLAPFFKGICMNAQMGKMKIFLTVGFGGGSDGTIRHMRESHANLVKLGLNDSNVDRIIFHMGEALKEEGVGKDLISEVVDIINGYRDEVLGR